MGLYPWFTVTEEHREIARRYLGDLGREPDVKIAPDGRPYLYRWHVIDRNQDANVYFHLQVASDPDRPLHDHPWDNMSVLLANSYMEVLPAGVVWRHQGQVIFREATDAHRLVMPKATPYVMTQFTTGPVKRTWGFQTAEGWVPWQAFEHTADARAEMETALV